MVEINLALGHKDYTQEDLDCTDIVEIAEESTDITLMVTLAAPSAKPLLFCGGDIHPDDSGSLERVEEHINERRDELDVFDEEVFSLFNDGYEGNDRGDECFLFNFFDSYEKAYQEAVRIEKSISMLDGSVTLEINDTTWQEVEEGFEKAIEEVEQRIQYR